jgi:hypothetical protein
VTACGRVGPAAAHKRQPNDAGVERAFPRPRDEAVVSKAEDRADSSLCRALGREEAQVLT